MIRKIVAVCLIWVCCGLALAEEENSFVTVTPIFNQLLRHSLPSNFETVFEDSKNQQYIREAVLKGENVNKWSQMITVTGAKGLASNSNITPRVFAGQIANGFQLVCPSSFSNSGPGDTKFGTNDGFVVVISCGTANPMDKYSESMLLVVIKGDSDYYTVQWSERGELSGKPIPVDQEKWMARLKKLMPIKLCTRVAGEPAPYPSCLN